MYRARVECDSIYISGGERLTTFVIEYPWRVLAEVATHRLISDNWNDNCYERTTTKDLSKNSASSRAIPLVKFIEKVKTDPYIPDWTANQKGMQGAPILDTDKIAELDRGWLEARDGAIQHAERLAEIGVHKQDVNPLLMPWAWVQQVLTSTSRGWGNFFALRTHKAAHPAFQKIARMMYIAYRQSTPKELDINDWHLPFCNDSEPVRHDPRIIISTEDVPLSIKTSVARCAWVSYNSHDGDGSVEKIERTFNMLVSGDIKHSTPLEHQATPLSVEYVDFKSNLKDWFQLRKMIKGECATFNPTDEELASWEVDERNLWPS